ncbi:MAG TPA: hypothetical protein VF948_08705 [Methylomirabilota bacterium]|jgi:hypothetical protein
MTELGALCAAKRTGTMFIATTDNHSARIGLVLGEITSLAFRAQRGMQALDHLRKVSAGRFSFSDTVMDKGMPSDLPDTVDVLALLVGDEPALPQPRPMPAPVSVLLAGDTPLARAREAIEAELTEFVGPIAPLLCREHMARAAAAGPPWDWQALVDAVAHEIGDRAKEERFKHQALARLRDHR